MSVFYLKGEPIQLIIYSDQAQRHRIEHKTIKHTRNAISKKISVIENGIKWKLEYKRVLDLYIYIDVNRRGGNVHFRFKSTKFLSLRICRCDDDNGDGDDDVDGCFSIWVETLSQRENQQK